MHMLSLGHSLEVGWQGAMWHSPTPPGAEVLTRPHLVRHSHVTKEALHFMLCS